MNMKNLTNWLRGYLLVLVPASIGLFSITAVLKLSSPVAVKLGLIDKTLAHEVPQPMLYAAAAIEFAAVFLLSRNWLSSRRKLQLLFLLATTFMSFRILAFNHLFAPHCGCFGPITLFTERIGQGLEGLLVVFLIAMFLGYPLQVFVEYLEEGDVGGSFPGARTRRGETAGRGILGNSHGSPTST
jgi:hypothetical protein